MSSQQRVPSCRDQFVQQWLENHAKYFGHPASKPEVPPLVTRIANRSFPSQLYSSYQHCEVVQARSNVKNLHIQPPYKVSPVNPPHPGPHPVPNNLKYLF